MPRKPKQKWDVSKCLATLAAVLSISASGFAIYRFFLRPKLLLAPVNLFIVMMKAELL
jgi:hypothetical protein